MALKNYTTSISVEKTIGEIEIILAKAGASHIFKMYDNGILKALAFKMLIKEQEISFKLPMQEEKIIIVFKNQVNKGLLPKKYWENREQAIKMIQIKTYKEYAYDLLDILYRE